jgi:hypothetical protein
MNTSTTTPRAPAQRPAHSRAAAVAAAGFAGLAGFQTALAAGAPLGRAAWGGAHAYLPPGLRIASGLAAAFWALAALVVLRRGGYRRSPVSFRASHAGTWLLAGLLTLGALLNFASSSNWERFLQAPLALVMAALCLAVARGRLGWRPHVPPRDKLTPEHADTA